MAELGTVAVGQSGGPTAVINASLAGVVEAASEAGSAVLGLRYGIQGALHDDAIDLTNVDTAALAQTVSAGLGSVRYKLKPDDYDSIITAFERHKVRTFVYIGGNDSMDTANQLAMVAQQRGLPLQVMGVPKTIDNDLPFTDHCPGYPSAARYVAALVRDVGLDCRAMRRIYFLEIMGRHAGWLAAASRLARDRADAAPHLILLPEHTWDEQRFLSAVERAYRDYGHCVVAVAEGFQLPEGGANLGIVDAFGHIRLGGVGKQLAALTKERLKLPPEPITDILGYIQRASSLGRSDVDAAEARMVGRQAIDAAVNGESGKMVTIQRRSAMPYRAGYGLVPLIDAANQTRTLDAAYLLTDQYDVPDSFLSYLEPLAGPLAAPYRLY
ncbi:MAG TPA: diphosphate--fructose-6-phosphate 1-phosphotransferase [Chloroflexota bacterium]|jgi:6-phosphofructokinase 1|nr:diphosphate--fructose-6-phosphate 1-phosphotransferase [Chloroflexota bacterium]